jgi:ubiquinone/menaquinone biosynthesis C-methylase UbiE
VNTEAIQHSFETEYFNLRKKEGRIVTDEELLQLPAVDRTHPLLNEWKVRRHSLKKLDRYLSKKNCPLSVLEVGCGNGWLCHQLSYIKDIRITGVDINEYELEQAKRVFAGRSKISFLYGNMTELPPSQKFDIIIFAASIQYFSSLEKTIKTCMEKLHRDGEVHIIDTNFYSEEESIYAELRSRRYFTMNYQPEMSRFYFHHKYSELKFFDHQLLYNPNSLLNIVKKRAFPFPWIRIKKC